MSEERPVTLEFIAAQLQRVLAELRTLRDDVDVLTEIVRRHDAGFDRLEAQLEMVRSEMREIRAELRVMHRQQQRTAARVRALEEQNPGPGG